MTGSLVPGKQPRHTPSGAIRTERPEQREAYREYLSITEGRSVVAVHEVLQIKWGKDCPALTTLHDWCRMWDWVDRSIADDSLIQAKADDRLRSELAKAMNRRRRAREALADIMLEGATNALLERDEHNNVVARDLTAMNPQTLKAIADFMRVAGNEQRLSDGDATDRIAGKSDEPLSQPLTPDAIKALASWVMNPDDPA